LECGGSGTAFSPPARKPLRPCKNPHSLPVKALLGGLPFAPSAKGGPLRQLPFNHLLDPIVRIPFSLPKPMRLGKVSSHFHKYKHPRSAALNLPYPSS